MFTIEAISPNEAVEIELNPLPAQDALRKALEMRDQGFHRVRLRNVETGAVANVEQFMRGHPHA